MPLIIKIGQAGRPWRSSCASPATHHFYVHSVVLTVLLLWLLLYCCIMGKRRSHIALVAPFQLISCSAFSFIKKIWDMSGFEGAMKEQTFPSLVGEAKIFIACWRGQNLNVATKTTVVSSPPPPRHAPQSTEPQSTHCSTLL